MRGLLTGVFCAVLVLAVAAASDPASAKKGKRMCTEAKASFCLPPLLVPVCTKKNRCGCQEWVCKPIFAAK
jgi:hypothetical protein